MDQGQAASVRERETIFALATAPGRAALAVVRISGPKADDALRSLAGDLPRARYMTLQTLRAVDGEPIDQALVVRFLEEASFTGERVAELHLHGGRATVSRVLRELAALPGLRMAEPGEFTRRALQAGRLDLAQAESLADLIDAETEMQRAQALALLNGELSRKVALWRERLIEALATIEASIDFSDEADVPETIGSSLDRAFLALANELAELSATRSFGRSLREGFTVAIVGPPNAGKSTLLNRMAGEDVAIESPVPGTTRDLIRVRVDMLGLPVWLVDTAGLRDTDDEIESIGVARARSAAAAADLRLLVEAADARWIGETEPERAGDIKVWLKADMGPGRGDISVSVRFDTGVEELRQAIFDRLTIRAPASSVVATERQAAHFESAAAMLRAGVSEERLEIVAEHVRRAARELELVVGAVDVEQVLDDVFSRFCIGK